MTEKVIAFREVLKGLDFTEEDSDNNPNDDFVFAISGLKDPERPGHTVDLIFTGNYKTFTAALKVAMFRNKKLLKAVMEAALSL